MDPILQLPPNLPTHECVPLELAPCAIVAEWPIGTFLENLVVMPDGDVIVSVMSEARLDRVSPDGSVSVFRQFDKPTTGIALIDGFIFVAVGEPGGEEPVLWRVNADTGVGDAWMPLSGMIFANGVTPFASGALLIADSWHGSLVHADLTTKTTTTWFQHEGLTRAPEIEFLPGANGVKRWGTEITVSSNGRAELYQILVNTDGSAGDMRRLADRLRVDDFAYDSEGHLYLTTHIGHSLDRLDRSGARVTLAGAEQGLAGSTACAFGAGGQLYVTTTGGIVTPPNGVLQPARLVRLDLDTPGWPLATAWEVAA